jgi:hypothetical protein
MKSDDMECPALLGLIVGGGGGGGVRECAIMGGP